MDIVRQLRMKRFVRKVFPFLLPVTSDQTDDALSDFGICTTSIILFQ